MIVPPIMDLPEDQVINQQALSEPTQGGGEEGRCSLHKRFRQEATSFSQSPICEGWLKGLGLHIPGRAFL